MGNLSSEPSSDELAGEENSEVVTTEAVILAETAEPWDIVQQIDVERKPSYVAFMNEQIGVTNLGQYDNYPSFTVDGGLTWTEYDDYHSNPAIVDIANRQSIWFCNDYALVVSKDGGQSLENLALPAGNDCQLLYFLNDEIGWSATNATLSFTRDGANSWEVIALPESVNMIAAISLRTPEAGYLLDYDGTLYSTEDGGSSWVQQKLEIGGGDLEPMSLGTPSAVVHFLDEESGVVILNLAGGGKSEVVALHTTDGGEQWERHLLPVGLGAFFMSHDGQYLTVTDLMNRGKVYLLKKSGQ
jgi:photosystem II stability/assembly factor-like uncharacterized protein